MEESIWEYIPLDLLVEIFKFLPRRDLLACSLVCSKWKDALNSPCLWSSMMINLDIDLMDPSTMLLTRIYYKHIKSLEMGFKNPQLPTRWMSHRFQEITKRVCRYIMILHDKSVQLDCLKIHDWYELCRFKKIVYHLSLFLRSQVKLKKISFRNAYLNKSDFIKIFTSVKNSENTISVLDLRNCYYHYDQNMLSIQFITLITQLENLVILKVDYVTLCKEVLSALLTTQNKKLAELTVFVQDDEMSHSIKAEAWKVLREKSPKLKVAFHFKNVSYSSGISFILKKEIPLTIFTISYGKNLCYREILQNIIRNYKDTLEVMIIQVRDSYELLDDLLLNIVMSFPKLQTFQFSGIIESFELIKEICKFQNKSVSPAFEHFKVTPKNVSCENQAFITQMYSELIQSKPNYQLDMKIQNPRRKNTIYYYY